jgi:hypothetical protein
MITDGWTEKETRREMVFEELELLHEQSQSPASTSSVE